MPGNDGRHVVIEWRPTQGFGVSLVTYDTGYGEGPDEVFTDEKEAFKKVIELLLNESTTLVPDYFELAALRKQACEIAGRLTNGWHPHFKFERGMAWYAIVYMIDMLQGKEISTHAQAQVRYYGQKFFPDFYQQVKERVQ